MYSSIPILFILVAGLTSCQEPIKNTQELTLTQTSNYLDNAPVKSELQEPVDLCKCLTEPGNSEWLNSNEDACREIISKEVGVENWEKINFSENPDLNRKWDDLVEKCTGSKKVVTGNETIDRNNEIIPKIGTSYGYIWEAINLEAQIYTTLAFDGLKFRSTLYSMDGETESENFTKGIEISGNWVANGLYRAEGVVEQNNVTVSWDFNSNYLSLTNNKGVVFRRVNTR